MFIFGCTAVSWFAYSEPVGTFGAQAGREGWHNENSRDEEVQYSFLATGGP